MIVPDTLGCCRCAPRLCSHAVVPLGRTAVVDSLIKGGKSGDRRRVMQKPRRWTPPAAPTCCPAAPLITRCQAADVRWALVGHQRFRVVEVSRRPCLRARVETCPSRPQYARRSRRGTRVALPTWSPFADASDRAATWCPARARGAGRRPDRRLAASAFVALKQELLETPVKARLSKLIEHGKEAEVRELGSNISRGPSEIPRPSASIPARTAQPSDESASLTSAAGDRRAPREGRSRGMTEEARRKLVASSIGPRRCRRRRRVHCRRALIVGSLHAVDSDTSTHRIERPAPPRRGPRGREKTRPVLEYLASRRCAAGRTRSCARGPPASEDLVGRSIRAPSAEFPRTARRHARRSRDPRPPPHVPRRAPGQISGLRRAATKTPCYAWTRRKLGMVPRHPLGPARGARSEHNGSSGTLLDVAFDLSRVLFITNAN